MKNWLYEVLLVITLSKRIYWSLILGVVGCFVITVLGEYQVSKFELLGPMAPLEEVIGQRVLRHYDKVAALCWISFWIQAFRYYLKDKNAYL